MFELDDPLRRAALAADPRRLLHAERPVLIDEWQRLPEAWDVVRRAVDADASAGQFLLTGSAAPLEVPTHTGAGRIVSLRMRPMALSERGLETPAVSMQDLLSGGRPTVRGEATVGVVDYAREIVGSGLPGLRQLSGRGLRAQLDGYLERIVDRDFEALGHRTRNPAALRRWMTAYAAATATTASYEKIRDAATGGHGDKPSRATTQPYRDVLEHLWIVEPLPAWLPSGNPIKRLVAGPKHHLADPALAARLLGVGAEALLEARSPQAAVVREGLLLGQLFESLATLCVRVYAQACEATVGYLRTKGGDREVDLIVERADHRVVGIEVKLAPMARDEDVRHLLWLRDRLGSDLLDAVVLTAGREAYRRQDGIAVVPLALLGP